MLIEHLTVKKRQMKYSISGGRSLIFASPSSSLPDVCGKNNMAERKQFLVVPRVWEITSGHR